MAALSSGMMSRLRGYPSFERGIAFGRMLGPSACGEFIRIDLTPSTAQPWSHRFATSTPALRRSSSGPARLVGALFEMCWTLVPVVTSLLASVSSHFRPDALIGSNVRPANIESSVTSPNRPEKMSMWVTPGNVSFVNCGKSSIVISPYFSFICATDQPPFTGDRGGNCCAAVPGCADAPAPGCAAAPGCAEAVPGAPARSGPGPGWPGTPAPRPAPAPAPAPRPPPGRDLKM